ncbi:MAG: tryptophan synthase subunit alpha [Alphaproteobacteria bacterium]|nr:tryptophan synthase subunit alpha [Alphaproteobacteria bacterium]
MTRLAPTFEALKADNRAGLIAYLMAGDPDPLTSLEALKTLAAAGADIIELGFPFTDPMADGPPIQAAAERSLKAGGSLKKALDQLAAFRRENATTPVVLMGYLNPIAHMGEAAFAEAAAKAGADGVIVVDLPPEEDETLRLALSARGMSLIRLATPTTDAARLPAVLSGLSGFVYYVSVTGVTGTAVPVAAQAQEAVDRLKKATPLPIAVGFGVRDEEMAAAIAQKADAVVVGSALVETLAGHPGDAEAALAALSMKTTRLARAVHEARTS